MPCEPSARRRGRLDELVSERDARAHRRERIGKAHVALHTVTTDAENAHRAAGQRSERQEIGCGRRIAFDLQPAGRRIFATRHDEFVTVPRHLDAEAPHQRKRHVDVGPGDQRAVHGDRQALRRRAQRRRHQQARQVLTRDVAANARRIRCQRGDRLNPQRRKPLPVEILDARAQGVQRVDEVADRAFAHPRHTVEAIAAAGEGQCRGQRTEGGAGVAEKEFGLAHRERAAAARDAHTAVIVHDDHAERGQRGAHHPRVVGVEQPFEQRVTAGQGGQQQHAIGDALRSGKAHHAAGVVDRINGQDRRPRAHVAMMPRRAAGCQRPQQRLKSAGPGACRADRCCRA